MLVEVRVQSLALDRSTNTPVVILQELEGERVLPIWIGPGEASAIAMHLADMEFARPLTHDLLRSVLEALDTRLEEVLISELKGNTFFAELTLATPAGEQVIDSRPSDAIALALRAGVPIYVAETVLDKAKADDLRAQDEDKLKKWLEEVDPDDLGKYTM